MNDTSVINCDIKIYKPKNMHKHIINFQRCRYLFTIVLIIASSVVIFSYNQIVKKSSIFIIYRSDETQSRRYTINTEGCTIPGMEPLSSSVKKFVHTPKNLANICPNVSNPLLISNKTHIWTTNWEYYNITDKTNFRCCYNPFSRPNLVDINSKVDDRVKYEGCLKNFTKTIRAEHEFVKVDCMIKEKVMYTQYFLFAVNKKLSLHSKINEASNASYNVIMLGIDAVSRLNFHRTMPRTLSYMQQKGAIELLGYNKVADNSYPNLVPLLTGYNSSEINDVCHPFELSEFDNCPFVWNFFEKRGYYSAFVEDNAYLGTFNYELNGFLRLPTHYYPRTFMKEADNAVGSQKDFSSKLCIHDQFSFKVFLDYVENLVLTLNSSRLFGFFWEVTMSHDYLNYPMIMDEHYENFLKRIDTENYLNKTILIILSDHGIRWGKIRSTKQGVLEERLPLFLIYTPPSFREKYSQAYKNLIINSQRLTTPFDIHETLIDLTNLDDITDEKIQLRSSKNSLKRGGSLFLEIPPHRTCEMAEISDHFCTCHESNEISIYSQKVKQMTQYFVKSLNQLLKDHSQCEKLVLKQVLEVTELKWSRKNTDSVKKQDEYLIVIQTEPGGGVFEGTMLLEGGECKLMGPPSRLNLYGNQSHCISKSELKLYCYCK